MQCLEKEPARRYQAVNELISDIDRHLKHESVLARPPSLTYALRKLARRNRGLCAFALTFLVLIITFAVAMTMQAQRIARERDQAERDRQEAQHVSNVAMNIFAIADPFQSFTDGINGPAVLDQAAKSIEQELRGQPAPRARLLRALGRAYFRRDQFKPAIACLREVVNILRDMQGAESETLESMIDLSMALRNSGDLLGAREILVDAEGLAKRHGLERSLGYARLVLNRGRISLYESRIPAARADLERSLRLYKSIVGPRHISVAEIMGDLSLALLWADEVAQAEAMAREAIDMFEMTAP
jgi:tetratricopeptide (TPR) repeat protein